MLKHLILKNLILIESCEIEFGKGLNILTGETGAGKTALIHAIALALGQRADSSVIRKGENKATVEASFEVDRSSSIFSELEKAGIDFDPQEPLLVKREISLEGKNRAFINGQMTSLPLLQKVGSQLIDLIGQHSHQELRTSEKQRSLIDLFADLEQDRSLFETTFLKEKALRIEWEKLQQSNSERMREIEICRRELQEIEEADMQEGEEERNFEEYQKLSNVQELSEKTAHAHQALAESPNCIISQLNRFKTTFDSLSRLDAHLSEPLQLFAEALIPLQESARFLSSYLDQLEHNPNRLDYLEQRLSILNHLKRKYGQTFEEIQAYKSKLKAKLQKLENLEEEIEKIEKEMGKVQTESNQFCALLTAKRQAAARKLEKEISQSLACLNIAGAEVEIEIKPQPRSFTGEDQIHFWLRANKGEEPVSVKESSSGGELSRLLFALKTTLAEKNDTPTLVFDEIDANVGGETATIIGEKLRALGKYRQVLCITHFPQVASHADFHFRVFKEEIDGRTVAKIETLEQQEKEQELLRMLGGKKWIHLT